jgi:hypothetical protein
MNARFVFCLWIVLILSPASALEIPVIVQESAGLDRTSEPVSGGIALPARMFRPGSSQFALFDGDESIPVQISELVVGPDGYARWILLDFQLDLKTNETRTLNLKTGQPKPPPIPLKISDTKSTVIINAGRIEFTIHKNKPFRLFEYVNANDKSILKAGAVHYTDALSGKKYIADVPHTINLHYAGPLRVTIEIRGKFQDDTENQLGYCTWITAWANRSDLLVRHSIINSRSDKMHFVKIKSSQIELVPADSKRLVFVADRLLDTDQPRKIETTNDGRIILEAAGPLKAGPRKGQNITGRPFANQDNYRWLYDCSHHSSEYYIDIIDQYYHVPPGRPGASDSGASGLVNQGDTAILRNKPKRAPARVWAFAPGEWYAKRGVLGVGKYGTKADESACHELWNWDAFAASDPKKKPHRFIGYEDNHYESEADSVEGLLLMFLRTGKRGYFDEAKAWARYHTDIQTWRTEGWSWKDGGIWFPQGGPPGNLPVRDQSARKSYKNWNQGTDRDRTLWRQSMAKSCYCHFYGAGLVDWFCLTGEREALLAAIDNCETKWDEFTHYRKFNPGTSNLGSTRGFGRGFYVAVRTWMVQPKNPMLQKLVRLCRDTLVQLPEEFLDERGVYAVAQNKYPDQYLKEGVKDYMAAKGITVDKQGVFKDRMSRNWKWRDIGGTWMISYIQHAANLLAENSDDEDLMDFVIASGQFTAKYMQSPTAKQTWYYTALDIPNYGDIWDEWKYDSLERNALGEGPKHSGWYTRFFPDCCARAYGWTGEKHLLEKAKEMWSFGNRRRYQTTKLTAKHHFANHRPPKDDSILSTARMFYEYAHQRADTEPPTAIQDLKVELLGGGKARISFTVPQDRGGKVARYQAKVADLPIVPYEEWEMVRDKGKRRNWWRAVNCAGEPQPKAAGQNESFVLSRVPKVNGKLYFAVRSFDDESNRSGLSNVVSN